MLKVFYFLNHASATYFFFRISSKMGSNGGEQIKISGLDAAECSQTTVQIKIKTLDSQTYNLRVDKCVIYSSVFLLLQGTF